MRETKFRAWDKAGGGWLDLSHLFLDCNGKVIGYTSKGDTWTIDKVELVEYTGLKDKNGKEIYEGDIIRGIFNSQPQIWTVGELSAYGLTFDRLTIKPYPAPYYYREMRHIDQWEVIGNIHENPELLE